MLLSLVLNILAQIFLPGGEQMLALQGAAFENHLRSTLAAPAPTSAALGAAGHVSRYEIPTLGWG